MPRRTLPFLLLALSLATCTGSVDVSETGATVTATGTAGVGGMPASAGGGGAGATPDAGMSAGGGGASPAAGGDAPWHPGPCLQPCTGPGCCLLSGRAGSGTSVQGTSIDADPVTFDLAVAGWYAHGVDLGMGPLPPSSGDAWGAALVARYDAAGTLLWARGFPGAMAFWIAFQGPLMSGLRTTACDDILVAGDYGAPLDLGCGPLALDGPVNLYFARLGP